MSCCKFHQLYLFVGIIGAFLRVTKKWYVPIILAAICFPGLVKASPDTLGHIGAETDHGAFVSNEELFKDFRNRWLVFVDGDFKGVMFSKKPLNFNEGSTELSGSTVEFLLFDGQERSFDAEFVADADTKNSSKNSDHRSSDSVHDSSPLRVFAGGFCGIAFGVVVSIPLLKYWRRRNFGV